MATTTLAKPLRDAEVDLLRLAFDLGALDVGGPLSVAERGLLGLVAHHPPSSSIQRATARAAIRGGADPLGEALLSKREPLERRSAGAFYTPPALVEPMLDWALAHRPYRLVDAGCGSGRFVAGAIRRNPRLAVVAVDLDPAATLLTRAALAVLGAQNAAVVQADYTDLDLPEIAGCTAFVGNPPYVRHHDLTPQTKAWAAIAGMPLGYRVSGLAGLHALFFLATALYARAGDVGCFVTSAEWLDVSYGSIIRHLLVGNLGGIALDVLEPTAVPFADAMTTAAIACFAVGANTDAVRLRLVSSPGEIRHLACGHPVDRKALAEAHRWSPLLRNGPRAPAAGLVPLGGLVRVHRGAVTGANDFFILTRERARALGLERWCRPAITQAVEILNANGAIYDDLNLRLLLDVPADIDRSAYPELDAYLRLGEVSIDGQVPLARRYIPSHRRPWWRIGLKTPPPIVASYMARRPPAFALNPDGLAVVNIAHGLYPIRSGLGDEQLAALVTYLNSTRSSYRGNGRTYHGGLEKFEPGEMEAMLIPADGPWAL